MMRAAQNGEGPSLVPHLAAAETLVDPHLSAGTLPLPPQVPAPGGCAHLFHISCQYEPDHVLPRDFLELHITAGRWNG